MKLGRNKNNLVPFVHHSALAKIKHGLLNQFFSIIQGVNKDGVLPIPEALRLVGSSRVGCQE